MSKTFTAGKSMAKIQKATTKPKGALLESLAVLWFSFLGTVLWDKGAWLFQQYFGWSNETSNVAGLGCVVFFMLFAMRI
jgi:uncharacterized BrkB/YihY/UPF0761 family membrane protein